MFNKGKFWEIDSHGYIVNDASKKKVSDDFKCSIETAIKAYQTHLGDKLHGIYVRGTVPRGLAIPGVSDLDTFAVVKEGETIGGLPWATSIEKEIIKECPDLTGVQFEIRLLSDIIILNAEPELAFVLKIQSVCVDGHDLSNQLPDYRPDSFVANIDISQIKNDIIEAKSCLSSPDITDDQARYWCKRIMKILSEPDFL